MYLLVKGINDRHFVDGKKYKIIKEESYRYIVIDERKEKLEVSKKCGAIESGRLIVCDGKKGNMELF